MAKRRMISQELIYDEDFNSLSVEAQLVFVRILSISDDCGVIPANIYTLKTLINVQANISEKLDILLNEICEKKLGFLFEYNSKKFFAFKLKSFENYQSYILKKATKSEYLKISKKEYVEFSRKFQEIPRNSFDDNKSDVSTVESIQYKAESTKQKAESNESIKLNVETPKVLPHGGVLQDFLMEKHAEIHELFRQWNEFAEKYGLPKIDVKIKIPNFRLLIIYSLLTDPDFDLKTTPSKVFGGIIKKNGGFYLGKEKNKFHADFDMVFIENKWIAFLEANTITDTEVKIAIKRTFSCPACKEQISELDREGHRYSCKNKKYWHEQDSKIMSTYQDKISENKEDVVEFVCDVCGYINTAFRPFVEKRPKSKTNCKKCNKEVVNEDLLNNKQLKTQGAINNVN